MILKLRNRYYERADLVDNELQSDENEKGFS